MYTKDHRIKIISFLKPKNINLKTTYLIKYSNIKIIIIVYNLTQETILVNKITPDKQTILRICILIY